MLVRAFGRRLRRLILPLVGFWDLVRRLEELRAQIATEAELARQRHDVSLGRLNEFTGHLGGRNSPLAIAIASEIDRLDGYLVHHAATLHDGVESLRAELGTVGRGLDAMRTDLVATAQSVEAARTEVNAAAQGPGRKATLAYAAPGLDALIVTSGFDLVVPTSEQGLLLYILRHGFEALEPGVCALLRRRLKPGAVAVDAGANIGVHSLSMSAAVGAEGRVHCFEPLPHLAAALERTLRLNGYAGRARVEQAALADEVGEATLHRAADGQLSSFFALPRELAREDVQVPVTTLDACFPAGSRVDFVKMDVEGAEPRVWRGMQRVVAENPAIEMVLEWSASHFRRSGEDPRAFMEAVRTAGFHAFVVEDGESPGRLAPVRDPAALEATNLLLTPQAAPEEVGAV